MPHLCIFYARAAHAISFAPPPHWLAVPCFPRGASTIRGDRRVLPPSAYRRLKHLARVKSTSLLRLPITCLFRRGKKKQNIKQSTPVMNDVKSANIVRSGYRGNISMRMPQQATHLHAAHCGGSIKTSRTSPRMADAVSATRVAWQIVSGHRQRRHRGGSSASPPPRVSAYLCASRAAIKQCLLGARNAVFCSGVLLNINSGVGRVADNAPCKTASLCAVINMAPTRRVKWLAALCGGARLVRASNHGIKQSLSKRGKRVNHLICARIKTIERCAVA